MTIYDIPGVVGTAFPRAMTPANIMSGFRVSGISTFDRCIFNDGDFLPSTVTEMPEPCQPQTAVATVRQQPPTTMHRCDGPSTTTDNQRCDGPSTTTRWVTNKYLNTSSVSDMLHTQGWRSLEQRHATSRLCMLFQIYHGSIGILHDPYILPYRHTPRPSRQTDVVVRPSFPMMTITSSMLMMMSCLIDPVSAEVANQSNSGLQHTSTLGAWVCRAG